MAERKMYNLDTSALLTLKDFYPVEVFPQVWEELDNLFKKGEAYIVEEVFNELEDRDDFVFNWVKSKKDYVVRVQSQEAFLKAQEIITSYPNLIDINSIQTEADPYVIADSILNGSTVVTHENLVGKAPNAKKVKIPNVCGDFGVRCISGQYYAAEFFKENGWVF